MDGRVCLSLDAATVIEQQLDDVRIIHAETVHLGQIPTYYSHPRLTKHPFMTIWCSIQPAAHGGRGLFATQRIPEGTHFHTCPGPYALVIHRALQGQVCAQCFSYSFDAGRGAWNVRSNAQSGSEVSCCSEECREAWAMGENFDGVVGEMNFIVDEATKRMKTEDEPPLEDPAQSIADTIMECPPEEITIDIVDRAWKVAEAAPVEPCLDNVQFLGESELDNARFLISGIIQRAREETPLANASHPHPSAGSSTGSWKAFLELQNNELSYMRERPWMLSSNLRVYKFLRQITVPALRPYIESAETVRALLSRDPANVFGIWDSSNSRDSEMLGWSIYISASYFNHNCEPNVKKDRVGRAFHFYTTRDVEVGEELCTTYIELEDSVTERRKELEKHWYFLCSCRRCERELLAAPASMVAEDGVKLN